MLEAIVTSVSDDHVMTQFGEYLLLKITVNEYCEFVSRSLEFNGGACSEYLLFPLRSPGRPSLCLRSSRGDVIEHIDSEHLHDKNAVLCGALELDVKYMYMNYIVANETMDYYSHGLLS